MKYFACVEFVDSSTLKQCKTWAEVQQPMVLESLAITKAQAFELSSSIAVILIIAYGYKIVERFMFKK